MNLEGLGSELGLVHLQQLWPLGTLYTLSVGPLFCLRVAEDTLEILLLQLAG